MITWALSLLLSATPLLATDGAGVVRGIETDGERLVLDLDPSFEAERLADLMRQRIPSAQVLVDGTRLFVEGATRAQVEAALKGETMEPTMDDVDALLASLRVAGSNEDGSGSSVRARRESTDPSAPGPSQAQVPMVAATVKRLDRHRFPLVLIEVKVTEAPDDSGLEPGQRITVLPRVRSHNGLVDPEDAESKLNVGAWYSKTGDQVRLILEDRPEGQQVYVATRFERIR